MVETLFLAFWNVENLFDTENAQRPEKIRRAVGRDLEGWSQTLLNAKLQQLSRVIRSMNAAAGPDILGVCEIENRVVLEKLTQRIVADGGRPYNIAHADALDGRGIDVAFLFDPDVVTAGEIFQHWVVKRTPTRELFQVNFRVNGKPLILIGNHWPSRTAGQYESEPYRMLTGETLSYWVERIHEEQGKEVGIVVMGDFNDEPFNRSLLEYAQAINDTQAVLNARKPCLLNLMWPLLAAGRGSHCFDGRWNMLDQLLVSKALVNGKCGWRVDGPARIEAIELMTRPGKMGPHRFGIKPDQRDTTGYSDHYPVSVSLRRKNA